MSTPEFISHGNECEFLTTRLAKTESAGPGLVRLYWAAERDGNLICAYTQIIPLPLLPALREAMLFAPPAEQIPDPGLRASMN